MKALPRKIITFNVRTLFYHWIPDKIKKNTLAMTDPDQKVRILFIFFVTNLYGYLGIYKVSN